jgi:hypothetical protein
MNHDMALWNVTLHPQAEPELMAPPRDMQALLDSGGDFADDVIAFEGELLRGPGVRVIRPAGREVAQGAQAQGALAQGNGLSRGESRHEVRHQRERLQNARADQLDLWADRVLDAPTLLGVFDRALTTLTRWATR